MHPENRVIAAAFVAGTDDVVTMAWDAGRRPMARWNPATGTALTSYTNSMRGDQGLSVSADGAWIAGPASRGIRVWDSDSGSEVFVSQDSVHLDDVTVTTFSPDGSTFASADRSGNVVLWDTPTWTVLRKWRIHDRGLWAAVEALAFSPDGMHLASCGGHLVKIWAMNTAKLVHLLRGHHDTVHRLQYHADGKRLISMSYGDIIIWDTVLGTELLTLETPYDKGLDRMAYSPDEENLYVASFMSYDEDPRGHFGFWKLPSDKQIGSWTKNASDDAKLWAAKEAQMQRRMTQLEVERLKRTPVSEWVARDPGAIKQWLAIALPLDDDTCRDAAVLEQQIPNEAQLRPREGDTVTVDDKVFRWQSLRSETHHIDTMTQMENRKRHGPDEGKPTSDCMSSDIARLLDAVDAGAPKAASTLLPLVYAELRQLAVKKMAQEKPGQTLQPTTLVHEAWLKVSKDGHQRFTDRQHFFRVAARAMQQILVDRARRKQADKRGGNQRVEVLDETRICSTVPAAELLAVSDALEQLEREYELAAEVVRLRYFVGMTVPQIASSLGIAPRTVDRQWAFAKAWLKRDIHRSL